MKQKNSSSYRKCSIFIPFLSHEIDTVSIKVGIWGHAKSAQLQEQQQQNCCCLHHVSENLYKQQLSGSQLNNRFENKEKPCFTQLEEPDLHKFTVCSFWIAAAFLWGVSSVTEEIHCKDIFRMDVIFFKCILFSADMLHYSILYL